MNLELVDLGMVLSNVLDGELHDKIKTINHDKFGSSGGDKREKEKGLHKNPGKSAQTSGKVETRQKVESLC